MSWTCSCSFSWDSPWYESDIQSNTRCKLEMCLYFHQSSWCVRKHVSRNTFSQYCTYRTFSLWWRDVHSGRLCTKYTHSTHKTLASEIKTHDTPLIPRPLHWQHMLRLKKKQKRNICSAFLTSCLYAATAHCSLTAETCAAISARGRRSWSWCPQRWDLWPSSCSGPCRGRGSRPPPPRSRAWCRRWCRRCVRWRPPSACVCAPRPAGTRRTGRSAPRTRRTPDARMSTAASGPCALKQEERPVTEGYKTLWQRKELKHAQLNKYT